MEIFARLSTLSSFSPRLSTVSIMPGMETGAPERTETRRGLSPAPNFFPVSLSRSLMADETSFQISSRKDGFLPYSRQA